MEMRKIVIICLVVAVVLELCASFSLCDQGECHISVKINHPQRKLKATFNLGGHEYHIHTVRHDNDWYHDGHKTVKGQSISLLVKAANGAHVYHLNQGREHTPWTIEMAQHSTNHGVNHAFETHHGHAMLIKLPEIQHHFKGDMLREYHLISHVLNDLVQDDEEVGEEESQAEDDGWSDDSEMEPEEMDGNESDGFLTRMNSVGQKAIEAGQTKYREFWGTDTPHTYNKNYQPKRSDRLFFTLKAYRRCPSGSGMGKYCYFRGDQWPRKVESMPPTWKCAGDYDAVCASWETDGHNCNDDTLYQMRVVRSTTYYRNNHIKGECFARCSVKRTKCPEHFGENWPWPELIEKQDVKSFEY